MQPQTDAPTPPPEPSTLVRDHLANERTLLAWVRTALTIVGLGFVVGRLLVEEGGNADPLATGVGAALVLLGGGASVLAGGWFIRIQHEIDTATFHPTSRLDLALSFGVAVAALVLAIYLVVSA